MFDNLRFQTRFFRARLRAIAGDFRGSAALLDCGAVPDDFRSLRDAYRLRMLVLAHDPSKGPEIIADAESFPWLKQPKSAGDEYAKIYCRYMAAGIRGNVAARKRWARELKRIPVGNIHRSALKVT